MIFNHFNKPWIDHILLNKDLSIVQEAIQETYNFMKKCHSSLPILPIPLIIEKDCYQDICSASKLLIEAQTKIIKFLLSAHTQDEILEMFNLPHSIKSYIDWDALNKVNKIIGRFDIVPSDKGYKFCEINADTTSGGIKIYDCFKDYGNLFIKGHDNMSPRYNIAKYIREMIAEHKFDKVIIFTIKKYLFGGSGTVQSLFDYIAANIPEVPVMLFDEESYPINLLNSSENKKTLIYRIAAYKDIHFHPLLTKIFDSGATIINKFETEIRWNKNWFSIFYDPKYQDLLTDNERAAILKFVPPSFQLTSENIESFLQNKNQYVFKLNRSYGGAGVYIGADNKTEFLREVLTNVTEWTVQEIIECQELLLPEDESFEMKPHKVVLGLFHISDKYSGILVRANIKMRVINMNSGTKIGWAFPCSKEERDNTIL